MWLAIISTIGVIISDIIRRVLIKLLKEKEWSNLNDDFDSIEFDWSSSDVCLIDSDECEACSG